jgi:hypothetical protein
MGNHYHLCLRTPEGNLHRVMQHLAGLYMQRFNRLHRERQQAPEDRHVSSQRALRSEAKKDRGTLWDRELWHGRLGMSRNRLKDAGGRKVSRSCQQHPANLPTKDLTPFVCLLLFFASAWAKLRALRDGAALASKKLWS